MSKKQEDEAKTSLEKLDELTKDILTNGVEGGDASFRHIVFAGLSQTKNPVLLEKMGQLLLEDEADLKKTIILGIFLQKERFEPILSYGEYILKDLTILDESWNERESLLLLLDTLLTLVQKNKLNDYDTALEQLFALYKAACSDKSTSLLADKLLQRFLNSNLAHNKQTKEALLEIITSADSEVNSVVIAIDILSRAKTPEILGLIKEILEKISQDTVLEADKVPLLDVTTLALSHFTDAKFKTKVNKLYKTLLQLDFSQIQKYEEIAARIQERLKKYGEILG